MSNPERNMYYEALMQFYADPTVTLNLVHHNKSDKLAIIVDPRFDTLMEAVIKNFMYILNPNGWNLVIMSYSGYASVIKNKYPNATFIAIPDELIYMDTHNIPNLRMRSYNDLFLSLSFWEALPAKHVLTFQKDCVLFKMFGDHFWQSYAFTGANFYNPKHISFYYGGINGGLSVRNRDAMIMCLKNVTMNDVTNYRRTMMNDPRFKYLYENNREVKYELDTKNEDVYFTHACEILRMAVPDSIHRTIFSIEADVNLDTHAFHGWNKKYHTLDVAFMLLTRSPLLGKYISYK